MTNKDKGKDTEIGARFLTWVGVVMVLIAIVTPFIIFHLKPTYLADLGPVGDFIGGTTVTFLTGASVFLLIATNRMQRKELQMSRQSIDEMVKQTEASVEQMAASVQQAEEARKETQITNETMKRQQFETTFFNMVTLHQNSIEKLKYMGKTGNEVAGLCCRTLGDIYYEIASFSFKKEYISEDYNDIVDFIEYLKMRKIPCVESVQINSKQEVLDAFHNFNFKDVLSLKDEKKIIREFFRHTYSEPNEDLIREAYYEWHIKYDSILGSYFNGIVTIVNFLHDSSYEKKDRENNSQDNKIYREVFFAQFSPHEMMLLYYYAKYVPGNEWLLEELKVYNLFYPRLAETLYLFPNVDKFNIKKLTT
ncbi:putative phage abortive infection protein [Bacillus cereus group sp. BfR-BA-01400]|uniref:putative phage abortive infection protein n=1 Tax=Bacillus cereus group sp. BfR-BA-01400 TaxID=2920334 RepID=UPI001F571DDA